MPSEPCLQSHALNTGPHGAVQPKGLGVGQRLIVGAAQRRFESIEERKGISLIPALLGIDTGGSQ